MSVTTPTSSVRIRGRLLSGATPLGPFVTTAFAVLGLIIVLGIALPALFGDATVAQPELALQSPSWQHLFGSDQYGRDVLLRCFAAMRIDLTLGIAVAAVGLVVGSIVGAVSATLGGATDVVIMRVVDVMLAIPAFVLALIITAAVGNNALVTAVAVAIAYLPVYVRLARAEALEVRSRDFISAARLAGASRWTIAITHVVPNSYRSPLIQATFTAAWAILDFAGLSFLGVGVQPPTPEWGSMIAEGVGDILLGAWWPSFFPGLMILLVGGSFQVIGEWLDRRLQ